MSVRPNQIQTKVPYMGHLAVEDWVHIRQKRLGKNYNNQL